MENLIPADSISLGVFYLSAIFFKICEPRADSSAPKHMKVNDTSPGDEAVTAIAQESYGIFVRNLFTRQDCWVFQRGDL